MSVIKSAKVTGEAANLAVSLDDMKSFLRITGTSENSIVTAFIKAATLRLENYCRRSFQNKTYQVTLDTFADFKNWSWCNDNPIYLSPLPLVSVSSVKTYAVDDTETTVSTDVYRVDTNIGAIVLKDGQSWPTDLRDKTSVIIELTAGYGVTEASAPEPILEAIKLLVADMYANRGATCDMPSLCTALLAGYKRNDRIGF